MELFEAVQRQLSEAQDEVVALRAENERLRADDTAKDAEIAKLTARCNRMCCSAKIEDVTWRPA